MLIDPQGGPWVIFAPQMIIGFASGFMLPNAIAGAVSVRPQAAGTAAGITGFMQMGLGAATSQLIGHLLAGAADGAAAGGHRAGAVRVRTGGVSRAGAAHDNYFFPTSSNHSSSVSTVTPASRALSSLEPAPGPATR